MDKIFDCSDEALELLVLEWVDWSLRVLIFISVIILLASSWKLEYILMLKEKNIFAEVLLGTTIWDGSKKKRSRWNRNVITLKKPKNFLKYT